MASDPKPVTGLEDVTSPDAERIILDMRGSPAEFWADSILDCPIFGNLGEILNSRYPNGGRRSATEWTTFHGVDVRMHISDNTRIIGQTQGKPTLRATQIYYSAYHKRDARFDHQLEVENSNRGIDDDDEDDEFNPERLYELPRSKDDRIIDNCRHVRVYQDGNTLLEICPRYTGPPGQEDDFRLYDYRGMFIELYNQLSQPDLVCQVPGCGRLALQRALGGYCRTCVRVVNAPCKCCNRPFGFQVPGTQMHTLCKARSQAKAGFKFTVPGMEVN